MPSQASEKQETPAEVTPIQAMRGHTNEVRGVVHLRGGRRIMACSWDGSLRLWDLERGTQIGEDWRDDKAKEAGVYNIALSPNGKTVVSGSGDGKVSLWDVETGKVTQRWTGHTMGVTSVCWSSGGNRVVSGSHDGTARVWNVKTGEEILQIKTRHDSVYAVTCSPDNTQIATGGFNEHAAKIWDAKTGELITTLKHNRLRIVSSLTWTSDGKKLITGSYGPIRIFDTATWRLIATLQGHTNYVNAFTLSRNNHLLASASDDGTACLWNLATNLPVGPPLQHEDKVECAAFSANGRVLVTGSRDKNVYAWDVNTMLEQAGIEDLLPTSEAFQGEHTPRSSLSDKSYVEITAGFSRVHIARSPYLRPLGPSMSSQANKKQETTVEITPIKAMRGHTNQVPGVVHLPGGRRIITCSWDGSLRLWDLESGTQIGEDWRDDKAKEAGVYNIALSPNGKTVVSGSEDRKVRLWDVETGKVIQKWSGHTDHVTSVCWSAGGDRVVSGSYDGTARVWNAKTGKTILQIKAGDMDVWAVKYSPDDTQIATGGYYKTAGRSAANIWDAKTGERLKSLQHNRIVLRLAWTSDGKKLITVGVFGLIRIFDTATWNQIATLEGHTNYVNAITVSHNNSLLASASDDNTAWLWNLATNLPVGPPLHHEHEVECAAFSANGRVLVTGGRDKNAYAWDIHAILKQAGLEDLLSTSDASQGERKSFLEADATRCHGEFEGVDELSPRFFDGMKVNHDLSPTGDAHPHSSAGALFARLASRLHRFRPDNVEANEHSQPPTLSESGLHIRVIFARLSSLIHRSPPPDDAPNELQQPSTPLRLDLHVLLTRLSSLLPRSRLNTDGETEAHHTSPSSSRPDAIIDRLSSIFRSQPRTNENIKLLQRATRLHVVEVAPMRDREVLFVAPRVQADRPRHQSAGTATPDARPVHSRPIRVLGHIGLFLCCVCNHQHADGHTQPTQQPQGQSQGQVQAQASSSQTQHATSASATSGAFVTHTIVPGASA